MDAIETKHIPIAGELDVFKARIAGKKMAAAMGFGEIGVAEVEIVISELGTNIVRHAVLPGQMIFGPVKDGRVRGIEIIARDKGPGVKEKRTIPGAKKESLGIGLSGVRRLTDEFNLQTKDSGTVIRIRKWIPADVRSKVRCSVLSKPKAGERVSGDAFFFKNLPYYTVFSVIDALGHGFHAHRVVKQVMPILENSYQDDPLIIIRRCHQELTGTRGAAIALCKIDFRTGTLHHISVGNVETRLYGTPDPVRPACMDGTLGMTIDRARVEDYPYTKGSCIVMFSDGISGKFDIQPALLRKSPQEVSNFIFTNYAKDYDDATVLVLK